MNKIIACFLSLLLAGQNTQAQDATTRLNKAVQQLLADSQMQHALLGFYVVNSQTGEVVCNNNGNIGMAPASTQKIVTAAAALDLLGANYRYGTLLAGTGVVKEGALEGDVYLLGQGDPTLGSSRYPATARKIVLQKITDAFGNKGIHSISGKLLLDNSGFSYQPLPGGWIWDDIGNGSLPTMPGP